jgi:ABC-2 type transport system ATP-binding protein
MMGEAEKMADEIILIHRGRIVLEGTLDEVRGSSGKKTVHIGFDGDGMFLEHLPHVTGASIVSNSAELTLAEGADPHDLLVAAMARLRIRRFELAAPSLEEIFIEKVGDDTLAQEETR